MRRRSSDLQCVDCLRCHAALSPSPRYERRAFALAGARAETKTSHFSRCAKGISELARRWLVNAEGYPYEWRRISNNEARSLEDGP